MYNNTLIILNEKNQNFLMNIRQNQILYSGHICISWICEKIFKSTALVLTNILKS